MFNIITCLILSTDFGNFLYVEASPKSEPQRARLMSPSVGPERRPVCLLFYYQLQGEGQDSLRVLLRDDDQEETLLWTLKGDQGPMWREGRTILPQSPKEYQVWPLKYWLKYRMNWQQWHSADLNVVFNSLSFLFHL